MRASIVAFFILGLCPLIALANDLADAKEEYLRTRKAAAKQLYDRYQKAIEDAKAKGLNEQANALDLEMRAFADREREALKLAAKPSPFKLFAEINQTLIDADSAQQLSTVVQRRDAVQKALETLNRRINDKPFSVEFEVAEVEPVKARGQYRLRFGSLTASDELAREHQILDSYRLSLSDRDAKAISPGDKVLFQGKLQGGFERNFSSPTGFYILKFDVPGNGGTHVITLSSVRARVVL